ncbi:MAG: glycerol-3-phosphate dehydrogenase [Pikeienuella sp.]
MQSTDYDVFVIGGGINGVGIARDAAGRGLNVGLAEMNDLGSATSSASTKLFHGGLRYLEYFEFGLVRAALKEREVLWSAMPHIAEPMRFVLPIDPTLRQDDTTSASKLLNRFAPWLRGRRPVWLTRLGLFLYDHIGGRKKLPATAVLNLTNHATGTALQSQYKRAFEYSDCSVDDARLVVLTAKDAAARGAEILPRTKVIQAVQNDTHWRISLNTGRVVTARVLINATGPWVSKVQRKVTQTDSTKSIRLVRGSHIVTRQLFDHGQPYFLQQPDGRIVFAIPYHDDYTMIGTTDEDHTGDPSEAECTEVEEAYLIKAANRYLARPITTDDVIWRFAGVRPLFDDGTSDAAAATRDYSLEVEERGARQITIFGGKITTYRALSEKVGVKLSQWFPNAGPNWTAGSPLPGGDFPTNGLAKLVASISAKYPFIGDKQSARLARAYGTEAFTLLDEATSASDLGQDFGAGLTAREVDWMVGQEWAITAEDVLWRRSKLGLRMTTTGKAQLETYLETRNR